MVHSSLSYPVTSLIKGGGGVAGVPALPVSYIFFDLPKNWVGGREKVKFYFLKVSQLLCSCEVQGVLRSLADLLSGYLQ